MPYYSDDPVADFDRYDRDQAKRLAALPVCCECDNPIQDEKAYHLNGEWICEKCMERYHVHVDNY